MSAEKSDQSSSGIGLTVPQIAASALAAATAAILGSFLGVLGTIGGAAAASIISTVGSALYQRSLERTRDRVKQRLVVAGSNTRVAGVVGKVTGRETAAHDEAAPTRAVPGQAGPTRAIPGQPRAPGVPVDPMRRVTGPPTPGPGAPTPGAQPGVRPGMPPADPTRPVPGAGGPPTGRPGAPGRVALRADGTADPTQLQPAPGQRPTAFIPQSRPPTTPPGGGPPAALGQAGPGGPGGPTRVAPVEPARRRRMGPKAWLAMAGVAASVFAIGLLASFGVETAAGHPLSGGSSGTSVGSLFGQQTGTGDATTTSDSSTDESTTATSTPASEQQQDGATTRQRPTTSSTTPRPSPNQILPNLVPGASGSGGAATG